MNPPSDAGFQTPLCELLGIRHPILQGAMQGAGGPRLVGAVSNAGGLGALPTFGGTEKQLREDIAQTRDLTDRPFAVNITPIGEDFTASRAAVVIELGVPIVTTGRGDPGATIVQQLREAGIVVVPVVPSVSHAQRVEEEGAHAIVASGTEAGGHVGRIASLPLVPQVVDAVSVPVVAAGGIADARGFVAALALGAAGVQIGTRFVATYESDASDAVKRAILAARETDTLVTPMMTGKPVRAIATTAMREYEAARSSGASSDELRALRQRARTQPPADPSEVGAAAGQISGMINEIVSVDALIQGIIADAAAVAESLWTLARSNRIAPPVGG